MTWGDNGSARPTTKEYAKGWDKVFGDKSGRDKEDRKSDNKLSDAKPAGDGSKNA